jgi:hypothetical protein
LTLDETAGRTPAGLAKYRPLKKNNKKLGMLELSHCKVDGTSTPGAVPLRFELSDPRAGMLHARFGFFCKMESKRTANWQQSFARRGLDFNDYERMRTPGKYAFRRKSPHPGQPDETCFLWGGDIPANLQGEVMTYVESVPILKASRVARLELKPEEMSGLAYAKLLAEPFRLDLHSVQQIAKALPRRTTSSQAFWEQILVDWNVKFSFLAIQKFWAPPC